MGSESEKVFIYEDEVRDNELDMQGIVNNANYFIYLTQARHKHIKSLGIDFADMFARGYNLVVYEAQIKFRQSLKSGDRYQVTSLISWSKPTRILFQQQVFRLNDFNPAKPASDSEKGSDSASGSENKTLIVEALVYATCVSQKTGRPEIPDELREKLK